MKLLKLKLENVLALLYIPTSLINITRSNNNFIVLSVMIHALIIIGVCYGIKEARKEAIIELSKHEAEIKEAIEDFKNSIAEIVQTKKEAIRSKLNDQVKRCFLKI